MGSLALVRKRRSDHQEGLIRHRVDRAARQRMPVPPRRGQVHIRTNTSPFRTLAAKYCHALDRVARLYFQHSRSRISAGIWRAHLQLLDRARGECLLCSAVTYASWIPLDPRPQGVSHRHCSSQACILASLASRSVGAVSHHWGNVRCGPGNHQCLCFRANKWCFFLCGQQ